MRTENGSEIRFVDWVRDVKVMVGALFGVVTALAFVIVFLSEVVAAPEVAREAAESARAAQRTAVEANEMAVENRADFDRMDRTLRITFCTSPFDLSDYARIQLACSSLMGIDR